MWSKTLEVLDPYEAIKEGIEKGVYTEKKLSLCKKIFRTSYTHNAFGIYKEMYLFNKKIYCKLVCRYVYE